MMKLRQYALFVAPVFSLMTACHSLDSRPANLDQYLQQFIGQSSAEIQKQLNFKSLGYKLSLNTIITNDELSYTILRPLSIPMSGSNATIGSNAMGAPVIRYDSTGTPSYDINFNCKVTFKLKDGVAEFVKYVGRAC